MTHNRATIHRLLDEHGLSARRDLGQNFVADANTVRRIAHISGVGPDDVVVEIGAGLGSLTLALAETGADVLAIEVDQALARVARSLVGSKATIVEADARTLDWDSVLGVEARGVRLVSNLPYNIGTSLIIEVLERVPQVAELLVLVQAEVADRLVARPGSKSYGIPSVLVASYAASQIVGHVPPSVFVPRPKVDSSLVRIVRDETRPVGLRHQTLSTILNAGFGQRRKMLRRSLASLLTEDQLSAAGVDSTRRAEELDLAEWVALATMLDANR